MKFLIFQAGNVIGEIMDARNPFEALRTHFLKEDGQFDKAQWLTVKKLKYLSDITVGYVLFGESVLIHYRKKK